MNEIKVGRMLLAGLAMLVVWVAVEILLEHVICKIVFGQSSAEMWLQAIDLKVLSGLNYWVNSFIALLNCTVMIWLYASLRPMYGVGIKTALITSAFGIILGLSLFINIINLGLIPFRLGVLEVTFEAIEFPIAMIVGAFVYEGREKETPADD
jgi:hypothetical protein